MLEKNPDYDSHDEAACHHSLSQLLSLSAIYTNLNDVKYFCHIDNPHSIFFFNLCSSVECRFLGQKLFIVLCLGLQYTLGWFELYFVQSCRFFYLKVVVWVEIEGIY